MSICLNKNSAEFQTLLTRSGLSEFQLEVECSMSLEQYGRFPKLDELSGVNSESYLREFLNITDKNEIDIDKTLKKLAVNTLEEANIKINNEFLDLEVKLIPLNKSAIVSIKHRPTDNLNSAESVKIETKVNDSLFFNNTLIRLAKLYGINFIPITNYELSTSKWNELVKDAKNTNAFIYNGNIYINIDKCSTSAPLHELMHLLLGSIRFTNPELYFNLVNLVEKFPEYSTLLTRYSNRSRSDANEEIFVTEFSNFVFGIPSILENLDEKVIHEIQYHIVRLLDSVIMGQKSVKVFKNTDLFNLSLQDLAIKLGSEIFDTKFIGSLTDAETHRILANVKEDLFKQGDLKEVCS